MEVYKDRAGAPHALMPQKKDAETFDRERLAQIVADLSAEYELRPINHISMKPYSPCPGLGISAGILESMVAHHFLTYLNVLTVRGDE